MSEQNALADEMLVSLGESVEDEPDTGAAEAAEEAEPQPEPAPEPAAEAEDSTPESADERPSVPQAALIAERKKRQELEERLRAYEEQKNAPKTPDVFEDPEGYTKAIDSRIAQATWATKVELSQDFMRSQHDDYDEREQQFMELVKETPTLLNDPGWKQNPARYAYETAVRHERFKQMQDPGYESKLRQEIEAEVRAKLEAELSGKQQKAQAKREAVMPTLTDSGAGAAGEDESVLDVSDIEKLGRLG